MVIHTKVLICVCSVNKYVNVRLNHVFTWKWIDYKAVPHSLLSWLSWVYVHDDLW